MASIVSQLYQLVAKNQRASDPVNTKLIPGMYLNTNIHVNSPRAGAEQPLDTKQNPHHFRRVSLIIKFSTKGSHRSKHQHIFLITLLNQWKKNNSLQKINKKIINSTYN